MIITNFINELRDREWSLHQYFVIIRNRLEASQSLLVDLVYYKCYKPSSIRNIPYDGILQDKESILLPNGLHLCSIFSIVHLTFHNWLQSRVYGWDYSKKDAPMAASLHLDRHQNKDYFHVLFRDNNKRAKAEAEDWWCKRLF